jgi:hypothetical protein
LYEDWKRNILMVRCHEINKIDGMDGMDEFAMLEIIRMGIEVEVDERRSKQWGGGVAGYLRVSSWLPAPGSR